MGLLRDFKTFLMRGNVVDLAVAVAVGAAFIAIVDALVADLITPIGAAIGGKNDFANLTFTINGSEFRYGDFLNAVISFLTVAAAVFFALFFTSSHTSSRSSHRVAIFPMASRKTKRPFNTVCDRNAFPDALMLSSSARLSVP